MLLGKFAIRAVEVILNWVVYGILERDLRNKRRCMDLSKRIKL